jgi:hypothetical protein
VLEFAVVVYYCLTMGEPFRFSQMDVDAMGHANVDGQRRSRRQMVLSEEAKHELELCRR